MCKVIKERIVADTNRFNDTKTQALLQNAIVGNVQNLIKYFEKRVSPNIQDINKKITALKNKKEFLSGKMMQITHEYDKFVFNGDGELNTVRGDNKLVGFYKDQYDNFSKQHQDIQKQLEILYNIQQQSVILGLLKEVFQLLLKIHEVNEAINWQTSAAYQSMSRYEKDYEKDEEIDDYNRTLEMYNSRLNNCCEQLLVFVDFKNYLSVLSAENNKNKMRGGANTRQH